MFFTLYCCLISLLHSPPLPSPQPSPESLLLIRGLSRGIPRQERTKLMVLSHGNEKGKLEVCRGSILSQECPGLQGLVSVGWGHECVPPCIPTSAGISVAAHKQMQRDHHVHASILGRYVPQLQAWQLAHVLPVSRAGCECISMQDTHLPVCKQMQSCTTLPTAPQRATALVTYKNILLCGT